MTHSKTIRTSLMVQTLLKGPNVTAVRGLRKYSILKRGDRLVVQWVGMNRIVMKVRG